MLTVFLGAVMLLSSVSFETILQHSEIISEMPMEDFLKSKGHIANFTSDVRLVELEGGVRGVLKVVEASWPRDAIAEVAAYRASEFLGLHFVPPTVFYDRSGVIGSLQYYVEPCCDLMIRKNYLSVLSQVAAEDLANMEIFYFIFGQWDPGRANLIPIEEGRKLMLIDNTAMGYRQKVRYGEYPYVLCFPQSIFYDDRNWGDFPFDESRELPPDVTVWQKEFGHILSKAQINQICQLKSAPITFVIWKGQFWRQYRFGHPSYTMLVPPVTRQKISTLTLENLKTFYENAWGFIFEEQYFADILERRDQILSYKKVL